MAELVLGTVQLGMPYGIANTSGKPDQKTATEIIRIAFEGGVRFFDTAQGYGDSEVVLGRALKDLGIAEQVFVITKFEKDVDVRSADEAIKAARLSCSKIGIDKLHGVQARLTYVESIWGEGAEQSFASLLEHELAEEIGVSVYRPEQARFAMEMSGIGAVQIPFNVADRRFEQDGLIEELQEDSIQLYLRSVYLQGLFFLKSDQMSQEMSFATPIVQEIQMIAEKYGIKLAVMLLQYAKVSLPNARIILGAETPEQMRQNIVAWNSSMPSEVIDDIRSISRTVDDRILNPSLWPTIS